MHPYHIHFMCKNTKDVQCKKQLHVDGNLLFSHPRGLTGQHPDSMRDRKRLFDLLFSESFWICWVSRHCLRVNIADMSWSRADFIMTVLQGNVAHSEMSHTAVKLQ